MTLAQIQCEEDRTFQKGVSILDAAGGLKLKQYVDEAPSAQNLIDLIPGWICRLPSSVPVTAGALELFADGKSIIELGPLEGGHTYMLLNAGAADVTAVEANSFGFLKCLIVKELLNLQRASFLLGNFVPWLAQGDKHADIVWASGVLYHMTDPVDLLESLSRVADTVYLWTHYVSDEEMPHGDPRRTLITETLEVPWHEHALRLYRRPYLGADFPGFMGGVHPDPMWMERDHILLVLNTLGFNRIDILPGDPAHPQGPNFALLARRTRRGFLDGVGLRTLYGWATDDHGPPPELTASVNGVARLVFTPSLERPDLLPFLGRSDLGFAPDLGIPLKIGDWVAVSTADGWQPRGSPMQITWLDGSREDKALALVNREMTILEIGPSFKPIACRSAGWHSYSKAAR